MNHPSRYSRNIAVIGEERQRRLSAGAVLVIGCGALGGQVAMLLAGAGIGRIGIADFDTIDISNLQRQLFFSEDEAGMKKAERLAARMLALNSEIQVDLFEEMIRRGNAGKIMAGFDFIVDATDNPASKFMIEEECRSLSKPYCIGGVAAWRGQVMSFPANAGREEGQHTSFSEIFQAPDSDPSILPCQIEGVIGAAASLIASVQAAEAIKYLTGQIDDMLIGKMLVADLKSNSFSTISLE